MADEEATEAAAEDGAEAPKKKKLSGKALVLFVALPLLLIGGGGGAAFMLMSGGDDTANSEEAGKGGSDKQAASEDSGHGEDEQDEGHGEEGKDGGHDAAKGGEELPPEEIGRVNYAASDLIFYELPDMIVNLNTSGNQPRFLKIRVALEFGDRKIVSKIRRDMPRIIDHFQVYLRELRREDLRGSAGMYRLKEELMIRVNQTVQPSRVRDVLFREMLVQ